MLAGLAAHSVDKLIAKAEVLLEALPYIQRFAGCTIVIKYGGHAMVDEKLRLGFAEDVVLLKSLGLEPVIVHGGGPQIGRTLERLGVASTFVRGMRVTDEATMEIVEMVLAGRLNKDIVTTIQRHGGKAIGLSGKDGNLIVASKMRVRVAAGRNKHRLLDLGLVGKVKTVHPDVIERMAGSDFIPVIAPIGVDAAGRSYNINADLVASRIAQAMAAKKLMLLTDVAGIHDGGGTIQPLLSVRQARAQIRSGVIGDGMVPKVECAINALAGGVGQVHIIDGRVSHAVLLEIFTRQGVGTEVLAKAPASKTKKSTAPARKNPHAA